MRLILAVIFGGLIGLEREIAGKTAGLKTFALVSLGSSLFTIISVLVFQAVYRLTNVSPSQLVIIPSAIVSGIGFIGAGLSALHGEHPELTTASGIWVAAGVGMATGFGFISVAISSVIIGLIVFLVFARLERKMNERYGIKHEG